MTETQPIDPARPLAVTLPAQDWQTAIALMNEGFRRLIEPMLMQLNHQAQTQQQPTPNAAEDFMQERAKAFGHTPGPRNPPPEEKE